MVGQTKRPKLGGAVYVLPNLITTGNLFFGFYSIVRTLQDAYASAALAIFLAAIFDILDGRVARLTKGTSEFGVQYDSLCDLVSFGLAPAFLMYRFGLSDLGRLGWVVCFVFLACGALRLARFNVQSSIGQGDSDFTGLPIPMAAMVVASFVAFVEDLRVTSVSSIELLVQFRSFMVRESVIDAVLLVMGPLLAFSMVSNIRYRSHKSFRFSQVKPFKTLVVLVTLTGVIAFQPEALGLLLVVFYALSGPFEWIVGWKKAVDEGDIFSSSDDSNGID